MTIGSVRVRPAVDGAARVRRGLLTSSTRQEAEQRRYHRQHEDEAGYADSYCKAALGYTYAVIHGLQGKVISLSHSGNILILQAFAS